MNIKPYRLTQQFIAISSLVFASVASHANPSGATVVSGNASFSTPNASTLNITNTPGTIINWQSFNIGANEVTNFIQQSASSAIMNRVTGGDVSTILGQMTSNGQVVLVNPAGIVFGQNSIIDTAGLIASTLDITDNDFRNHRWHFEDIGNDASILNQGFIHTADDGEVVLIAPNVTNEGVIDVEQGNVMLAAGESVTIHSLNFDAIEFEVQAPDNEAVNIGTLMSDGGSIGVFAGSIHNSGVVSANAISVDEAGTIRFVAQADNVQMDATVTAINARGEGGDIEILGDRVGLFGDTEIDASGGGGGGTIHIGGEFQGGGDTPTASTTLVGENVDIRADAVFHGNGGEIIVWADDYTLFSGTATANSGFIWGDGGFIEISGKDQLGFDGFASATTRIGTPGTVLFDPRDLTIAPDGSVSQLPGSILVPNDFLSFAAPIPTADIEVLPSAITDITNTGTAVELQANRNIFINADIISSNAGSGGDISFLAGQSITLGAGVTIDTDGGTLQLFANNVGADTNRGNGTAEILMDTGSSISTGSGNLEIWMGPGPLGDASGDITLAQISSNHVIIVHEGTTPNGDVLQQTGTELTASSVFINHDGPTGGQIGTSGDFFNINADNIAAHIHGATSLGIFIEADNTAANGGTVTIGDTCYGDNVSCNFQGRPAHIILGLEVSEGGSLRWASLGDLIINEQVMVDDLQSAGVNGIIQIGANGTITSNHNIINDSVDGAIDLDHFSGPVLFNAGTYRGIFNNVTSNDDIAVRDSSGQVVFDSVTLGGQLFIEDTIADGAATTIDVVGDLFNNDVIWMSGGSVAGQDHAYLNFTTGGTLDGNGFVEMASTGSAFAIVRPTTSSGMTLGVNQILNINGNAQVGSNIAANRTTNEGWIVSGTTTGSLHSVINVDNAAGALIRTENSSQLNISNGTFTNAGTLEALTGGFFVIQADVTASDLAGLVNTGGGTTRLASGATFNIGGGSFTLTDGMGDIDFTQGEIANGTIIGQGGSNLFVSANSIGTGTLTDMTLQNITLTIGLNDTVNVNGDLTLSSGLIELGNAAELDFLSLNASLTGLGEVRSISNGGNSIVGSSLSNTTLTIDSGVALTGRRMQIGNSSDPSSTIDFFGQISSNISGQSIILYNMNFDSLSYIEAVNGGDVTFATGARVVNATMHMDSGSTFSTANGDFTLDQFGFLTGEGTFDVGTGLFTNDGTVTPGGGGTISTLTIKGEYVQSATGFLEIDFVDTGTTPGTDHDQLIIDSTVGATLGGDLLVSQQAGPPAGDLTFVDVINGGTISGTFNSVTNGFNVNYNSTFADLVVSAATLFTWTGLGDGWGDPSAWDLGSVPGSNDDIRIDGGFVNLGNLDVFEVNNATVTNTTFNIGTGADLTINGDASFDISSPLTVSGGGALTVEGDLVHAGTFNLSGTATLNGLNNTLSVLNMTTGGKLQGTGATSVSTTFLWSESTVSHALTIDGDMTVPFITGNAIVDGGIVTLSSNPATRSIANAVDIINNGQLINRGDLTLEESSSIRSSDSSGTFDHRGGVLNYNSTSATFNMGVGTGLAFITSGDIDTVGGTFNVTSSTPMQWNGGRWYASAGGNFQIDSGFSMNGSGISTLDGTTVTINADSSIDGTGDLDIINSGSLVIPSAIVLTHNASSNILSTSGNGTFQVADGGTFVNAAGSTDVSSLFDVLGNVSVQGGKLVVSDPSDPSDNGVYSVTSGATLEFATDRTLTNTISQVDGAETVFSAPLVTVNAGTIATAGTFTVSSNAASNAQLTVIGGLYTNSASLVLDNTAGNIASMVFGAGFVNDSPGVLTSTGAGSANEFTAATFNNLGTMNIDHDITFINGQAPLSIDFFHTGGSLNMAAGATLAFDAIDTFGNFIWQGGAITGTSTSTIVPAAYVEGEFGVPFSYDGTMTMTIIDAYITGTGSDFTMNGGTLNVIGYFSADTDAIFTMNGGTMDLVTGGIQNDNLIYIFDTTFNWNGGTISATGVDGSGTGFAGPRGLIYIDGTGVGASMVLNGNGVLDDIDIYSDGDIVITANADHALVNNVAITNEAAGVIEFTGDGTFGGATGTVTIENAGEIKKTGGVGSSTLIANLTNEGTIGGLVDVQTGTLVIDGDFSQSDAVSQISGAGILNINGLSTLSGGSFLSGGAVHFLGGVDINGDITHDRDLYIYGGSLNNATVFDDPGVAPEDFILADGIFTVTGLSTIEDGVKVQSGAQLDIVDVLSITDNSTVQNDDGTVNVDGTLDFIATGFIDNNAGTFNINADGTVLSTGAATQNDGVLNVDGMHTGDINNNTSGTLLGDGLITGMVTSDGTVAPGSSPGVLDIDGDLILLSNSSVILDLLGTTQAGIDHDQLNVTGQMSFDGALLIATDPSTSVQLQDTFAPLTYGTQVGSFSRTATADPNSGYGFDFDFGPNGLGVVVLSVPGQDAPIDPTGTDVGNHINTVQGNDYFVDDVIDLYDIELDEDEENERGTLVCS